MVEQDQDPTPEAVDAPLSRGWRFGDFRLLIDQHRLDGPNGPIALRPQAFAVLHLLIERAPSVVRHAELLAEVWGGVHVSESALPHAIGEARKALGDSASSPRFVVTHYGRGYSFVHELQPLTERAEDGDDSPPSRTWPRVLWAAALSIAVLIIAALGASAWAWRHHSTEPQAIAPRPTIPSGSDIDESSFVGSRLLWAASPDEPSSALRSWLRAMALAEAGFHPRAAEVAASARRAGHVPDGVEGWIVQAVTARLAGDPDRVCDALSRFRDASPGHLPAQLLSIDALLDCGRVDEAERLFTELDDEVTPGSPFGADRALLRARIAGRRGRSQEQIRAAAQIVDFGRARSAERWKAVGWRQEAAARSRLGEVEAAAGLYRRAADTFKAVGDVVEAARCALLEADERVGLESIEEVRLVVESALAQCRELANTDCEALAHRIRGRLLVRQSRFDLAAGSLSRAEALYTSLGDATGRGRTLQVLADLDFDRRDFDSASRRIADALALFRRIGDRPRQVEALVSTATFGWMMDDRSGALDSWTQALDLARGLGDRRSEGTVLLNLGFASEQMGDRRTARDYNDAAITVLRAIRYDEALAHALYNASVLAHSLGDAEIAVGRALECSEVARRLAQPALEARAAALSGEIVLEQAALDRAARRLEEAVRVARRADQSAIEAEALVLSARLERYRGRWREAEARLGEAETLVSDAENRPLDVAIGVERALVELAAGRVDHAAQTLRRIESLAADPAIAAEHRSRWLLAKVTWLEATGRDAEARDLLRQHRSTMSAAAWDVDARLRRLGWLVEDRAADAETATTAATALRELHRESMTRGYVVVALELRLALAAVQAAGGADASSRDERSIAVAQARRLGLDGILTRRGR